MNPVRATAQTMTGPGAIAERTPGDLPADGNRPAPARGTSADAKLHLTLAILDLRRGGAERMVLTLAGALLDLGHRVDLLLTGDAALEHPMPDGARLFLATADGDIPPETTLPVPVPMHGGNHPPSGEALHYPGGRPTFRDRLRLWSHTRPDLWRTLHRFLHERSSIRTVRSIARYLEAERPDCVFANLPHAKINCLLVRRLISQSPPVVPIVHSLVQFREELPRRLYPRLLPAAPRIVAVSHAVADSVRALAPRAAGRIVTIHNPVDLDAIGARASEPPPHPWLEESGTPVILAAGSLVPAKNFPLLLHAFARVLDVRPCRLLILGEGAERPRLEALTRQLELTGKVALPGWVENPWAAMARASMFALSSRWEGFPTVLIEALACGCPVVSTDAGGAREILDGGGYGELVPVDNEERLAGAILRTLEEEERTSPEQRRQKRMERVQRARTFAPERAVAQYLGLLGEVLPGERVE